MSDADGLRYTKIPLNNGSDEIPALAFGGGCELEAEWELRNG